MSETMYKSATLKLTAWYLVLVMAISLTFSAVVFHLATDQLTQRLESQEARIYREFPVFSGNPFFVRDTDVSAGAHSILLDLAYFNIVVLIAAGAASYWLARRTLEPIAAANERQRRFVADASHELRTPVTALKMDSEVTLLDQDASKADLRKTLESNLEEADKLDTLITSLLRLSQLESSELRQSFTSLTLGPIIEAALKQVQERAAAKQVTIDSAPEDYPLYGDRSSLTQLLVVLLDNAIKYSPEHSTVDISSHHHDSTTTITIRDHGMGIEPDALEHVFDRFYRADKARSGSNGFGLGLSIAQRIADLHGGTITLSSTLGKGTTARVQLPSKANDLAA